MKTIARNISLFASLCFAINSFGQNPIITDMFTADPAAIVHNDTVFIYTGHDEASATHGGYVMNDWQVFSSVDMVNWTAHGEVFNVSDISWSKGDAWASEVEERNGKFYLYFCTEHKTVTGKAIGVAVSNSPTGPFTDALGHALITNNQTTEVNSTWDDIDPTVYIDDEGQAYLYWGNSSCHYVKLKENMVETEGDIVFVDLPSFTEAPYLHKYKGIYYLSYAYGWPEKIAYATSSSLDGPWTFQKIINDNVNNCGTNHQSIIEFKNQWYFIYHTGDIGGDYRRSVAIEYLFYNSDNSIVEIAQTPYGVANIDSTAPCPPIPLQIGHTISGDTPKELRSASVVTGEDISLTASSTEAGTWRWEGPNNFTSNSQAISLNGLTTEMAGRYLVTFTGNCGTKSYADFRISFQYEMPDLKSGETYTLVPYNSNEVISVENSGTTNGSNVIQDTKHNLPTQKFIITFIEDVFWKIAPESTPDRGLDVYNISLVDGANIVIWDYWGGSGQQWQLAEIEDGIFNIISRNSGKCLTVDQSDNNLIQWTCNGDDNQKFKIVPDDTPVSSENQQK